MSLERGRARSGGGGDTGEGACGSGSNPGVATGATG